MSYKLRDAIWTSALPARLRLTALAIASYADDDGGSCFPSQETLAGLSRQSERKVRGDLAELERLRILEVLTPGRRGRATRYHFHAAALPIDRHVVPPIGANDRQIVPPMTGKSRTNDRQIVSEYPAQFAADPIRRSGQGIRSGSDPVRSHTGSPVADAIRELREIYEIAAIWTKEDGDQVHAIAEHVTHDDVTRTTEEVRTATRPSWPLALTILRRVAAARRDGRDPWAPEDRRAARPAEGSPTDAMRRSLGESDSTYGHLYRRD